MSLKSLFNFFWVFLVFSIFSCSNDTSEVLFFEDSITPYDFEEKRFLKPSIIVSIEGKYIIDTLVLKIKLYDQEYQEENFFEKQDKVKNGRYFGNFRDKDGFDLFDFPIVIQEIPTGPPGGPLFYHFEQKKINITRKQFEQIDFFSISVNNDVR